MNYFLKKAFFFTIGYLLINIAFYFTITKPAIFDNYIFNEDSFHQYSLFFLSDSHAACMQGIPNQYGIYNFAHRGDNYLDMYLKAIYLSQNLTSKDTILLSIDDHLLSGYRNKSGSLEKNLIYANYDLSELSPSDKKNLNIGYKKHLTYLPLLDVNFGTFYFDYFLAKQIVLYHTSFSDYSEKVQEIMCQRRYREQYKNMKKSHIQEDYLKKIIHLCKEKNITLIGMKFPISKKYWNMIKEHDYDIENILEENNIKICDFHDLFFDRTHLFYDQDHLNVSGAKILCETIKSRKSCK